MFIFALILHTLVIGGITLFLIFNGWPVLGVVEYFLTLFLVVALVRRPWWIQSGSLYLKHNIFFTRRLAVADIVAIERHVGPLANNRRFARFEIVLRDGTHHLFVQQILGTITMADTKLSAVTSWMPASAAALAAALNVPLVEAGTRS